MVDKMVPVPFNGKDKELEFNFFLIICKYSNLLKIKEIENLQVVTTLKFCTWIWEKNLLISLNFNESRTFACIKGKEL